MQDLIVLAILKGGGTKTCHPLKGVGVEGGLWQKVLPCLERGGGAQKVSDPQFSHYVELSQRPYIIETMHSYTLPMLCLSGLCLFLLTGGTAVCGHS